MMSYHAFWQLVVLAAIVAVAQSASRTQQRKSVATTTTTPKPAGEEQDEQMPMDMILNHCPVLCSPDLKTNHPLRHLVPSYSLYGSCMDDCICAAYCYMMDDNQSDKDSAYDSCFVRCSTEVKPFTNDEDSMLGLGANANEADAPAA